MEEREEGGGGGGSQTPVLLSPRLSRAAERGTREHRGTLAIGDQGKSISRGHGQRRGPRPGQSRTRVAQGPAGLSDKRAGRAVWLRGPRRTSSGQYVRLRPPASAGGP